MSDAIPLVDLAASHAQVADDVAAGWAQVLARTAFVGGPQVCAFEAEYAAYLGVGHVVGVANGTDAIELALRALDIGPGHECVLPANTFIATAEAVARTGATPVLVDCDPDTALVDVDAALSAVTDRTRAIIPVHLYGQTADAARLRAELPERVAVVEDAAQAQGARRDDRAAGTLGDIAATSFYPGKNLGAYGDAGAVLTASADLAERVRLARRPRLTPQVRPHRPRVQLPSRHPPGRRPLGDLGKRGDFPVTEAMADLTLPLYPEITEAQQERVVEALQTALRL